MIVYTDSPGWAAELLGGSPAWGTPSPAARWAHPLPSVLLAGRDVRAARLEREGPWQAAILASEARESQLDALHDLLAADESLPGAVLCIARAGRGFHGQRGRPWEALPGNLHLVAGFRPPLRASEAGGGLTVLPVVALLDAVDAVADPGRPAGIKWVNDILVAGCKVGGALTRTISQGDELRQAVFGLGLNVEAAPDLERSPFVPRVGCLADLARPCSLPELFRAAVGALEARYRTLCEEGPAPLVEAYRRRSLVVGLRVRIHPDPAGPDSGGAGSVSGRVVGIGEKLELHLEGREEPVTRGRLALLDPIPGS